MNLKTRVSPTHYATIHLAGDIQIAKQVCREYCINVGLCVTIEPQEFIYAGGQETGYRVGLLNYPRFPSTSDALIETARELSLRLMEKGCQWSALLVTPDDTYWLTRRSDGE